MVGLNFATCFLRPDGRDSADMTLDPVKRHIEHMLKLAGEDYVGIGSDYDGATTPKDIGGVEGLPVLIAGDARHEPWRGADRKDRPWQLAAAAGTHLGGMSNARR